MKTFCPECGFGVAVDEDGCCLYCGSVATGSAVDDLEIPKKKRYCTCGSKRMPRIVAPITAIVCRDCGKNISRPGRSS